MGGLTKWVDVSKHGSQTTQHDPFDPFGHEQVDLFNALDPIIRFDYPFDKFGCMGWKNHINLKYMWVN